VNPLSEMGAWGYVLFWGLTALAAGIFLYRGRQLWQYLRLGRKDQTFSNLPGRIGRTFIDLVAQRCQWTNLFKKNRAGIGHAFMAWGFLLFVVYYVLFIIIASGFGISESMEHNKFYAVYCWIMDIVAPFIMIGALWAIIRRYIIKPPRIKEQRTFEAGFILFTVLVHPITHIGKIATQIAADNPPAGLGIGLPPISNWVSSFFTNPSTITSWHNIWFWSHWVFVIMVLAIIAYTRYMHFPAGIINDVLRNDQQFPKGKLNPIDIKDPTTFGVSTVSNFTQKQLLDTYACVVCGHCQDVCPAYNTQKKLNPRLIIRDIKTNLLTNGPHLIKKEQSVQPLIGDNGPGSISEEVIWQCTTCGACMENCPMYIEHVPKIIDMRRHLVQMRAQFPPELLVFFENIEQRSNPWGIAPSDRAKWTTDQKVDPFEPGKTEYLFYVGCAGAFDARNKQVTTSIAHILNTAGVSWGILGKEEKCCGDSMRRLGNEFIFDRLAKENIKMFQEKGIKKIITQCPHCFNTLKNDYQQYGIKLEVYHHSEFINNLIKTGRISIKEKSDLGKTVIHDSCYLGRYNHIYTAPREVITSTNGHLPIEMERNSQRSFCCGAGGGRMWMEENAGKRINLERVQEALKLDVNTVGVCCPYCLTMFEDGIKDEKADARVKVLDIAEIVSQSMIDKSAK
jgi:Fe-S oxidoreductase